FGLTQEPFLVFTANAFALMGLRQLYFLLGGLLNRLVYLSVGLAVILGFIGIKMILEALHTNNMPFLNGGEPLPVPTVGVGLSLAIIVSVLVITIVASLVKVQLSAHGAVGARRTRAQPGDADRRGRSGRVGADGLALPVVRGRARPTRRGGAGPHPRRRSAP
ncbi:MAG: hypothetical protein M3308_11375, partial [Actinomycetota bacterium]|nr:hypothetical protein [Actinomycetota bacterium]